MSWSFVRPCVVRRALAEVAIGLGLRDWDEAGNGVNLATIAAIRAVLSVLNFGLLVPVPASSEERDVSW